MLGWPMARKGRRNKGGSHTKKSGINAKTSLTATFQKNNKGFGFIVFDGSEYEDTFIPPRVASSFFHNDRVSVTVSNRGEIINIKVIEHQIKSVVGVFHKENPTHTRNRPLKIKSKSAPKGWVVYQQKSCGEVIPIVSPPDKIKDGDIVKITLLYDDKNGSAPKGKVESVFGSEFPATADLEIIAGEFNLTESHPKNAVSEAKKIDSSQIKQEAKNRLDLRDTPFITIDGEDARDFDDAIYVEKNNENYILWVSIADVSHYVKPHSPLDLCAYERGTSVYFPEKAFHMLPSSLSEGVCSLVPNEDRLVLTLKITLNKKGECIKTECFNAVINSHRRATYTEIQNEYELNRSKKTWELAPHFELYQILKKKRHIRGSIDFDFPEPIIKLNKSTCMPEEIVTSERRDSNRLIEEFMIAANESVTEWVSNKNIPFIFRIHERPNKVDLDSFLALASNHGVTFKLKNNEVTPKTIGKILLKLENNPAKNSLQMHLLRSLKQAVYSSAKDIHFGLASEGYTHFTSPIRRYPDIIAHRMVKLAISKSSAKKVSPSAITKEITTFAEHCNVRERHSIKAERASTKLKQVRIMSTHLGDHFDGEISSVIKNGLFIQLKHPFIEGFVKKESLSDDSYFYDENKMLLRGRRTRNEFKIGQKVAIQVANTNLIKREIDFIIVSK